MAVKKNSKSINIREEDLSKKEDAGAVGMEKKFYKMDFSALARGIISDIDVGTNSILFKTFPKKKVMDAIQEPQSNVEDLRDISNFLYTLSPHYKRLCNYHSDMLTLDWYIAPYKLDILKVKPDAFKKVYNETLFELENMNIKHEMSKILQTIYREGIFFGYQYMNDDSYFIQKLNPDFCRISANEDGVFNFAFNFEYFNGSEEQLVNYAPEFETRYNDFKNGVKKKDDAGNDIDMTWQELDSENTICIKTDETIYFPFPPFIGVLPEVYEMQDYKALKKANTEMQNVALLSGKIPMNSSSDVANDFKVTLDTALQFGNKMTGELPDQVGFILSVFDDMQMFRLGDDKTGTDKVEESVSNYWEATGVSKNLFTDGGSTDASVRASLITDEQSLFVMLRQIERWINRKLKFNGGKFQFKINMVNTTWQNQKEKSAEELKAGQFGIPNKIRTAATMGIGQSEIESMAFLENIVLAIPETWIPLQSSHTQKGDEGDKTTDPNAPTSGDKGRPSKEEDTTRTDDVGVDE